ncbi:MAG: RHS repeat domain-containing protein [Bacteroidota bacterium]
MQISKYHLIIFVLILGLFSCKKYDDEPVMSGDSFRIKQISEYNDFGEETGRDVFSYKGEKIVLWQWFYIDENGVADEKWKVEVTYRGDNLIAAKRNKNDNKWELEKECTYKIRDNIVYEEVLSRYGFPRCIECWKYNYYYSGTRLTHWNKFVKNENSDWEECWRGEYIYEDNKLVEYHDLVVCEDAEWKQDYKRKYHYTNNILTVWEGGIHSADGLWSVSQKAEYGYENGNMAVKNYLVWDDCNESWKIFGSLNYFYDENNNLVEKTTSSGERTEYTYEPGQGNASLLYYNPTDFAGPEPFCKSAEK